MTPQETLLAAAERLENLVAEATPGPWTASANYWDDGEDWRDSDIRFHPEDAVFGGHPQVLGFTDLCQEDAELIATMNPLVAAGLAELFRDSRKRRSDAYWTAPIKVDRDVLALAQLVLGGE